MPTEKIFKNPPLNARRPVFTSAQSGIHTGRNDEICLYKPASGLHAHTCMLVPFIVVRLNTLLACVSTGLLILWLRLPSDLLEYLCNPFMLRYQRNFSFLIAVNPLVPGVQNVKIRQFIISCLSKGLFHKEASLSHYNEQGLRVKSKSVWYSFLVAKMGCFTNDGWTFTAHLHNLNLGAQVHQTLMKNCSRNIHNGEVGNLQIADCVLFCCIFCIFCCILLRIYLFCILFCIVFRIF